MTGKDTALATWQYSVPNFKLLILVEEILELIAQMLARL